MTSNPKMTNQLLISNLEGIQGMTDQLMTSYSLSVSRG